MFAGIITTTVQEALDPLGGGHLYDVRIMRNYDAVSYSYEPAVCG